MNFKRGDKVRFLNDVGEGVVKKLISSDEVIVEDENGFEYPFPASELIVIDNIGEEQDAYDSKLPRYTEIIASNVSDATLKRADKDFSSRTYDPQSAQQRNRGDVLEVDLHMHELVDNERGLSNSEMIAIQMEHFERMMKRAEQTRTNKVVFIHGVGEGVLRNEIRRSLEEYYPNCEYHDANYNEYGYGATEVLIRH